MTIAAGIICEYNPFHNGHKLQIDKLRQEKGADVVVCALSGHFMQRGEPALVGKEQRVRMALACGADLVVELPALYATRSANWFALGGVSLLAAAGATHLAFGAETDDLAALQATAERLAHPDEAYTAGFRRYLTAGLSFSEAQAKALNYGSYTNFVPVLPNDRLALSYLQIIAEKKLPLSPILIPREGSAYHDPDISGDGGKPVSATAIRKRLEEYARHGSARNPSSAQIDAANTCTLSSQQIDAAETQKLSAAQSEASSTRKLSAAQIEASGVAAHIPEAALPYLADAPLVFPSDAAPLQLALLRRADRRSLLALPDMNEGLEYRILDAADRSMDLGEFYRLIKTKRYTMTRLQRMVTHLLIDYRETHAEFLREGPPYLRILGANAAGRQLLHSIRKTTPLPIVTRASQMKALAKQSRHAANAWEIERRATAMYGLLSGAGFSRGNPEYFVGSIMTPS